MARQGDTKGKILKLISEGKNNPSKISETLNLAPSTVSKHLRDLEISGNIEQEENEHVKKWKYYRINPNLPVGEHRPGIALNRGIIATFIAAALLALVFSTYLYSRSSNFTYVPISVTDPPQVPSGTQALYINYSSLSLRVNYGNNSEWIAVNSTGRINLMDLINASQVIGGAQMKISSTIDKVKFNVTSASMTVDNMTYDVQLAQKEIAAEVEGDRGVNASSGILLDFSPVVTAVYSGNTTQFVLLPTLRALVISQPELDHRVPNGGAPLNGALWHLKQQYQEMFSSAGSNVTITKVTMGTHGNVTSFRVWLKDSGHYNVTVIGIALDGYVMKSATSDANALSAAPFRTEGGRMAFNSSQDQNSTFTIGAPEIYSLYKRTGANSVEIKMRNPISRILITGLEENASLPLFAGAAARFGFPHPIGVVFLANKNGTLSLPFDSGFSPGLEKPHFAPFAPSQPPTELGYELPPGSSALLSFSGSFGPAGAYALPDLTNGTTYRVTVITSMGPVQANVTAG